MRRVFLFGNGWGAIAAYKGLSMLSNFSITVVTEDDELSLLSERCEHVDLNSLHNEVIVFDGYKPFVSPSVLKSNTCINIHHSLLPSYRGLHSMVWAILNDEPVLGFTIHLMNEYMDDGDIIFQKFFENDFKHTSKDYMEMCNSYKSIHLGSIIERFLNGEIVPIKQDKSKASWVGRRTIADCKIDFGRPISYQRAFFRALVDPYPLPYVVYRGEEFIVKECDFFSNHIETHLGRVLNIDGDGLWVKIKDGYMIIKELEDRSGNTVPISNFKIGCYFD